jgi:hypothetical protein
MNKVFSNFIGFKKINLLYALFSVIILITSVASCKKDKVEPDQTFKGAEVTMGNGKANSYLKISGQGTPMELGMEFTATALTGLSQNPADFANLTFVLPVDQKVLDLTPFDHLALTWAPAGHPPTGRFDVPHFDFYFYIMTAAEQNAIAPYSPATAASFENFPAADFLPSSYNALAGGIPRFGKSWVDASMPLPLTHSLVYGSYNGKVVLQVAMGTKTLVESGATINAAYAQSQKFEKTGKWYPTRYNIYKDNTTSKHYFTLSDFVKR